MCLATLAMSPSSVLQPTAADIDSTTWSSAAANFTAFAVAFEQQWAQSVAAANAVIGSCKAIASMQPAVRQPEARHAI